jgi:hypothetical protein
MPKIQWTDLPAGLRQQMFDRLEDRQITVEDLYQLKLWRESEPEAPDGLWYKDFGSFKICGEGRFPKTFLLKGQAQGAATLSRCSDRLRDLTSPVSLIASISRQTVPRSQQQPLKTAPTLCSKSLRLFSKPLHGIPNSLLKCCRQSREVELQKANRFFLG